MKLADPMLPLRRALVARALVLGRVGGSSRFLGRGARLVRRPSDVRPFRMGPVSCERERIFVIYNAPPPPLHCMHQNTSERTYNLVTFSRHTRTRRPGRPVSAVAPIRPAVRTMTTMVSSLSFGPRPASVFSRRAAVAAGCCQTCRRAVGAAASGGRRHCRRRRSTRWRTG